MSNIPSKVLQVPSRDQITSIQLNSLLSVAGAVSQMLHSAVLNETNIGNDDSRKNDGGVKCSLETTLIGACTKLDEILADTARWDMKAQTSLEAELSGVYVSHKVLLDKQMEIVQAMEAPHRRVVPQILKLQDGLWAAILGDPKDLANSIVGIGDSPQAALDAYDREFLGADKDKQNKAQATTIEEILPDENNVDPGPTGATDKTPKRRPNKCGGSKDNGPH